eukprot:753641-Pyramimonas_sp.AAC.1
MAPLGLANRTSPRAHYYAWAHVYNTSLAENTETMHQFRPHYDFHYDSEHDNNKRQHNKT